MHYFVVKAFSISNDKLNFIGFFVIRDHPFKTSACLRGEGCPPLLTFADARGGGVLGLPTSAIFEIINLHIGRLFYIQISFILESI